MYGATVSGFGRTTGWTSRSVRAFLSELPPRVFREIGSIRYVDEVDAKFRVGLARNLSAEARADILIYRHPLELTPVETVRYQAWTLSHEYAHVAFDRVLAANTRHAWGRVHLNSVMEPAARFVTELARDNLRDDFSECFAAYVIARSKLASTDRQKYDFIANVYQELSEL